MSDRPFKILGIQQIAVGGRSKERLRRLWVDTLGLSLEGNSIRGDQRRMSVRLRADHVRLSSLHWVSC